MAGIVSPGGYHRVRSKRRSSTWNFSPALALALSLCSYSHRMPGPSCHVLHRPQRRAAAQKNRVRSTKGLLVEHVPSQTPSACEPLQREARLHSGGQVRRLNTNVSASGDLKSIGSIQILMKRFLNAGDNSCFQNRYQGAMVAKSRKQGAARTMSS